MVLRNDTTKKSPYNILFSFCLFSNLKGRRCKSVAHLGGELYRKRKTESESPSLTWAGSCTARPHTKRGVGTKDTKNVDEKPDGKAGKEEPRECLLLSCVARSSSIAALQLKASSLMETGEISNFADICERCRFKRIQVGKNFESREQIYPNRKQYANMFRVRQYV